MSEYQVTLTGIMEADSPEEAASEFRIWIGDNYPLTVAVQNMATNQETEEQI